MVTIAVEENSSQAKQPATLPYATVVEEKKKNFREAAAKCNAVSVGAFIDKLHCQIDELFDNNA